jgi:hypothetical protein
VPEQRKERSYCRPSTRCIRRSRYSHSNRNRSSPSTRHSNRNRSSPSTRRSNQNRSSPRTRHSNRGSRGDFPSHGSPGVSQSIRRGSHGIRHDRKLRSRCTRRSSHNLSNRGTRSGSTGLPLGQPSGQRCTFAYTSIAGKEGVLVTAPFLGQSCAGPPGLILRSLGQIVKLGRLCAQTICHPDVTSRFGRGDLHGFSENTARNDKGRVEDYRPCSTCRRQRFPHHIGTGCLARAT